MNSSLRCLRLYAITVCVLCASAAPEATAQGGPTEYQVKAVFLFNFSRFIDWPPAAFETPDAPFVIGVLGEDPFGADLDEVVRGEKVDDHPLRVQRFARVEDVGSCHILYISRSEQRRLEHVMQSLAGRSVLTVGDHEDFARRGGMIELETQRSRVRLNINLKKAEAVGLKISSKLLRPARIVNSPEE